MPIVSGDIEFRLSTTSGSAGNSTAQADPDASLGKYMSTTAIVDATLGNLFDNVSGAENAASDVEYRCLFVYNTHATLTLEGAACWISSEVSGGASVAIGLDPAGNVADDSASDQAATIADESSAPAGVSFSAPTSFGAGLSVGDLGPGECRAIWVRRTAANTSALNNDGATISVQGDTAE
jgi:hypothetical protein